MNDIYVLCSVYNNQREIRSSIESYIDHVDKIIVADGVFGNFPHDCAKSTDKTKEYAHKACGNKIVWIENDNAWKNETTKRNAMLDKVPNGDYFVILDADELLISDYETNKNGFERAKKYNCCLITCYNFNPYTGDYHGTESDYNNTRWIMNKAPALRFYKKREGMKYKYHHSTLYVDNVNVSKSEAYIDEIEFINAKFWRNHGKYTDGLIYRKNMPKIED